MNDEQARRASYRIIAALLELELGHEEHLKEQLNAFDIARVRIELKRILEVMHGAGVEPPELVAFDDLVKRGGI